jgi:hypothetical protein
VSPLYQWCIDALDGAGWQHSEPNASETLGTQLLLDGVMLGGSLRVIDGSVVRFLAFNSIYLPEELDPQLPAEAHRLDAVEHLIARLNPTLDAGHFELDPVLGIVCRTAVDLGPAMAAGAAAPAIEAIVMALVGRATAHLAEQRELLEAVVAGADPDTSLDGRAAA